LIVFLSLATFCNAQAQTTMSVSVMPPYSNKLSDYTATPGKLNVIINSPYGLDGMDVEYYLLGTIINSDESIIIRTRRDYKPPQPMVIKVVQSPGGAFITPPYVLTYNDIRQIFDEQNLEYSGITRHEVMQNGLPEGIYTICLDMIHYTYSQNIIAACSAPFSISSVEAPIIISPLNNTTLREPETKNVVFTWTRPPNAPVNTQYKLKIIELNSPTDNFQDKIRSAGYPTFFETTVNGNAYLYSAANPALKPGKTYAFVVSAIDPSGGTAFRNKGFSEINLFTYQKPDGQQTMIGKMETKPGFIQANKEIITSMLRPTTLKGTLVYQFKNGGEKKPLSGARIKLVEKYIAKNADGTVNMVTTHRINKNPDYMSKDIKTVTTGDNGEFSFTFLSNNKGEPLAETDCYVIVAKLFNHPSDDQNNNLFADLSNTMQRGGPNPGNMTLENSATDNNSCKIYRCYGIEIEGEHARYYLNPDQELRYFFEVNGGDTKDAGEVVSLVKTIDLNVRVEAKDAGKFTINNKKELANMNVYIYRKVNFDYPSLFPENDVTPDKTDNFPPPKGNGMICVGKGLTDENGIARIKSLVLSDNPTYQYFMYIRMDMGNYNYESKEMTPIDFKELVEGNTTYDGKTTFIPNLSLQDLLSFHSGGEFYTLNNDTRLIEGFDLTQQMELKFPTLRVIITEKDGNKQIDDPQTRIVLEEKYSEGTLIIEPGNVGQPLQSPLTVTKTMAQIDGGRYEINNLPVASQVYPAEIKGPSRKITIKAPGFDEVTLTVKEGNPLYFSERYEMPVLLNYGAKFKGTVFDAETNKPLDNVFLNILGETSKSTSTGPDGKYYTEVKKLDTDRTVVITREGYMSDTVVLKLNKSFNGHNFVLYRKARRLRVRVWSTTSSSNKKGFVVTLPNVPSSWRVEPNTINNTALQITTGSVAKQMASIVSAVSSTGSGSSKPASSRTVQRTSSAGMVQMVSQSSSPYTVTTDENGVADFMFTGGGDENQKFEVQVTNSPTSSENIESAIVNVEIPVQDYFVNKTVTLLQGGCLSGMVYLGEGTEQPVSDMVVEATYRADDGYYTVKAVTDASGKFLLRNLPGYSKQFKLQITAGSTGANYVGILDEKYSLGNAGDVNNCKTAEFHIKSIKGVDLTRFMGFPFVASGFNEESDGSITLTGKITLPKNEVFEQQVIEVKNIKMVKSTAKNAAGDFLLVPASLPFVTDINNLTISIGADYKAKIKDESGLKITLRGNDPSQGEMKAGVQIVGKDPDISANFGGYGYKLPDIYLTSEAGSKNRAMTIFSSAGNIDTPPVGNNGFYITDGINENLVYSIDGFENKAIAEAGKSFFDKNGLTLQTKLKVTTTNLNPSSFDIDAGALNITKKEGLKAVNQKPFDVKMGQWSLKCNQWAVTEEGVKVSNATLSTGVDVSIENLKFTSTALETDKATVHLEKIKLLGVKEVNINTTAKGLTYKYLHDGVSGWSLYAVPEGGMTTVATLQGLPGISPADKVEFISVDLNSEGESYFVLNSKKFRLYNIVDFTPFPNTYMYVTTSSLKLMGNYDFGIPNYMNPTGAMGYFKKGNELAFAPMDMQAFTFTHHNVHYDLSKDYILSDKLFIAKGTAEEPGNLPELNVTMRHTPTSTRVDIDKGQSLPMGAGKQLANLAGGIDVVNKQWDVLRFEGEVKGMNNVNPGQKMNFEVKGAVQATGQTIAVSDIPAFPGLSITYDLPNSRFIGSADINMDISGLKMQGYVNTIMDSQGWLFNAGGLLEIPGIGGTNMYALFGDYVNMPPEVSSRIGNAVCLPNSFKTSLQGFFISAGLTKQILPKIDYNYGIVAVQAGVDISVNARTYMIFGQGATFGLGILAEGHAYLSGSCPVTCTSANADAKLQLGISGDYNTKTHFYNIDGCSSLSLKISASQCLPVLIDCGPCVSVTLADFTIGAKVHLDNVNGFSMGITTTPCDQQCK